MQNWEIKIKQWVTRRGKKESEMDECESLKRCGRGSRGVRVAGVYGLQMWRAGVLAGALSEPGSCTGWVAPG